MEKIVSRDGTPIAYHRRGAGPPLVLVHGTGAANPIAWTAVLPALEERFCVYALDRRGRGESGDGVTYALDREFEDVAAVVDAAGEPANLLGHSFGGLCALEAALLTRNVRRLVLYEPAIPFPGRPIYPAGLVDRLQRLLDAGDGEGAWTQFMREAAMLASHEIEQLKASPAWPARLGSAHTLPREMRAEERYKFQPQRFQDLNIPTLLLLGSETPDGTKEVSRTLDAAL
ncbi:MAG TPA: alpha/beta fold hydrolase, partial [Anaerolineae bacterium]|nr:alpha/beta fold hydrolase [Anaerolineae bacterium]